MSDPGSFACTADQAAPGFEDQLGDFFIRSAGAAGTHWDSFIIEYDAPTAVTAASGEIWDIDRGAQGWELFYVSAYDDLGNLLATETSPQGMYEHNPATLDAKPWAWTFSGLSDIDKIVFTRSTEPGAKPLLPAGVQQLQPNEREDRAGTFNGPSHCSGPCRTGHATQSVIQPVTGPVTGLP